MQKTQAFHKANSNEEVPAVRSIKISSLQLKLQCLHHTQNLIFAATNKVIKE